ncbi:MAG: imidazoleglycerol-phosphate dehydratase HisB [Methanobacterium sp.]|nr:imidazoleglycerol-phosphate dehydratase HisB [Methanobacterium sp.]
MERKKKLERKTSETDIKISINLDGEGKSNISTGIEFFDHMLEAFARHGLFDLEVFAEGDTGVDDHHTVEDVGILLGEAINQCLGDKKGIKRMAHALVPMDESLAMVAIDISGRSYTVLHLPFKKSKVGQLSTENVGHFMESVSRTGKINLHARCEGENDHHQIEALFKALARSLHDATRITHQSIPSTKGVI